MAVLRAAWSLLVMICESCFRTVEQAVAAVSIFFCVSFSAISCLGAVGGDGRVTVGGTRGGPPVGGPPGGPGRVTTPDDLCGSPVDGISALLADDDDDGDAITVEFRAGTGGPDGATGGGGRDGGEAGPDSSEAGEVTDEDPGLNPDFLN